MHFSTIAVAALATIPSIVSAFRLGDISNPYGTVTDACDSQFNIPLMSCGRLPAKCSPACVQQLENLQKTLQDPKVCGRTKDAGGLLLVALEGDLVDVLCENDDSDDDSDDDDNNGSPVKPTNTQLSFSGTAQIEQPTGGPSVTSLIIDTSLPTGASTRTQAFPDASYTPTTLRTTSGPQSTQGSSDNNGGPFTSQDGGDNNENSAMAIRAGLLGVAAGVFAVIINIA